jgi:hypothetical protein
MAKNNVMTIVLILAVMAGVFFAGKQMGFFATTGEFTLASFELDQFGDYWFSGDPLSFSGSASNGWADDQGKFNIQSTQRPFVGPGTNDADKGYLIVPQVINWNLGPGLTFTQTMLGNIAKKDIKWVYQVYGVGCDTNPKTNTGCRQATVGIVGDTNCQRTISLPTNNEIHVLEWRSSNLQEGYGALFSDGIKICERVVNNANLQIVDPSVMGQNQWEIRTMAIGQRLPFNCRIDTSHEAFFVERFPAGSRIDLKKFSFEPVAFCGDSPVVQVASAPVQGVTSTTEPFLRWAEGKTLTVPDNQVWLVTYVADWKLAGLSSGCAAYDRYLVNESKCESEARIVVATKDATTGEVKVDTLTETGSHIEETVTPTNVVTLDQAPVAKEAPWLDQKTFGIKNLYLLIAAIAAILIVLYLALRGGR